MTREDAEALAAELEQATGKRYEVCFTEKPIAKGAVRLAEDNSYFVARVER